MNTELEALPVNLDQWLAYIGRVHPREIELGLSRVQQVASALQITTAAPQVVTVAGTNGKGTTVACLEALLCAQGVSCGSYTSPHIHRFNERIHIKGQEASDLDICRAFATIEEARGQVSLSYFEFATLAALILMQEAGIEVAILEVGLGGRLDAVNIIDPQVSIITSISLDHEDWLGHDRDTIALEKAGILRAERPFVCGDPEPPASLLTRARELNCQYYQWRHDFQLLETGAGNWRWQGRLATGEAIELEFSLPVGMLPANVGCALQALALLPGRWPSAGAAAALREARVAGRQEWRRDIVSGVPVLLDVAHNPASAAALADCIGRWRASASNGGRVSVVFAAMADKKVEDMAVCLQTNTDIWYIAQFDDPRCLDSASLLKRLSESGFECPLKRFDSLMEAYREACAQAAGNLAQDPETEQLVVVTGSFMTVAALRNATRNPG